MKIPRNIKTKSNLSFSKSEKSKSETFGKLIDYNETNGEVTGTKMRNRLRDLLKTPQGDWYEGKLTRHDNFDALAHIDDSLNRVPVEFTDKDRRQFMASCFGHFLTMNREIKFSGGVIHRLLLREIHRNGPTDEM
ncbi:hypothetical protein Ddye_016167 [Dipteronia dyeriana]|uniref:Uncharacterized protein n=1 Tax=Dipteronia dyeriana TaxID=168575 RepID=A0AAD9WZV2_9ROSI|nr:hypothetical protein Ddye_016167 [Dipteronia dyeriana]